MGLEWHKIAFKRSALKEVKIDVLLFRT